MSKIIFTLAVIISLASQVHATRCDICRLDTCRTFYWTDNDQDGDGTNDSFVLSGLARLGGCDLTA